MSRLNNLYLFLNDEKGRTLPRAKLFFYENNSFDFKNTYADKALTSVNPNPVIADGAGRFPNIFLEADTYRVVLQDEDGVEISTKDDVDNLLSDGDNISNTTVTTSTGSQTVAGALDDRVVRVGSVAGLAGVTPTDEMQFNVGEFWPGTGIGGGIVKWNAARSKTEHNGVTVIDPGKLPELGAIGEFGTYFTAAGSGEGVFERPASGTLSLESCGGYTGIDNSEPIRTWLPLCSSAHLTAVSELDEIPYSQEIDIDLDGGDLTLDVKSWFVDPGREIPAQPSGFADTALGLHIDNAGVVNLGNIKLRNEFRTELVAVDDLVGDRLTQFKIDGATKVAGSVTIDGNMGGVIGTGTLEAAGKSELAPLFAVSNFSNVVRVDLYGVQYPQTEGEPVTLYQCTSVGFTDSYYKQAAALPGYYSFTKIIDCGNVEISGIDSESRSSGSFMDAIVDRLVMENVNLDQPSGKLLDMSYEWGGLNRAIGEISVINCKANVETGIFTSLGGGYTPVAGDGVELLTVRDLTTVFGDSGYRSALDNIACKKTNVDGLTVVNGRSIIGGTGRGDWSSVIDETDNHIKNLTSYFTEAVDSCRIFASGDLTIEGIDLVGTNCPYYYLYNEYEDGQIVIRGGNIKDSVLRLSGNVRLENVSLDNVLFELEQSSIPGSTDSVVVELVDCSWDLVYGDTAAESRNFQGDLFTNLGISNIEIKMVNPTITGMMKTKFDSIFDSSFAGQKVTIEGGTVAFFTSADGVAVRNQTFLVAFNHNMGNCDFRFKRVTATNRITLLAIVLNEDAAGAFSQRMSIIGCIGEEGYATHGYIYPVGTVSPISNAVVSDIDLVVVNSTFASIPADIAALIAADNFGDLTWVNVVDLSA